ncbi:DNA cytosine methyltransferase [Paenibacillus naphthalenovorans]|uniref:DNA cytosine methyltransferase n=1 Tax=Paenibacillus naphthalenovorans TaxID=162209 RepID=UPI0010F75504|nr:DNA cytosine methyltransferase [Paenibacillus naphthalenovorans]
MRALSLFSGIGGIDLACEWAGIETVAFCEREPFPQKVLRKHWPNVPIYDDVCTLTKERLETDGIIGSGRTIDIIHGGYPCQPFSVAGERKGTEDDRHLWPEVFRLIQALHPKWFVGENVAGHITLGLDIVLSDLESAGYAAESFVIPACAVGARHRRDRVFIVAHSYGSRGRYEKRHTGGSHAEDVPNANSITRLETYKTISAIGRGWEPRHYVGRRDWAEASKFDRPSPEPAIQRVVDGISGELDEIISRLKALGNAVVPRQIYPILSAIKQIDDMLKEEAN